MSFSERSSTQTESSTSAGAIVYVMKENKAHFLILTQNYALHRDRKPVFLTKEIGPSGRVENGEDLFSTALREVKEETGLELDKGRLDPDFSGKFSYCYFYTPEYGPNSGKMAEVLKTRVYFLARISEEESNSIILSQSHTDFKFIALDEINYKVGLRKEQYSLLVKAANHIAIRHNFIREEAPDSLAPRTMSGL